MRKLGKYICTAALLLASVCAHARSMTSARRDFIKGPMTVKILRIIDGDTVVVRAHVWIGENMDTSVRFSGMDAPEMHAHCYKERVAARAAKAAVAKLLKDNKMVISNIRLEKYAGRVLAHVETTDGLDIGRYMIKKGLARPYYGGHRKPWCTPSGDYRP